MLSKTPQIKEIDEKWASAFERPLKRQNTRGKRSLIMPPPNVTGNLHMGHALTYVTQDVLIRFWELLGYDVLAQPGLDHAGIATQMVVERDLARKGLSRKALGREGFKKAAFAFKNTSGEKIIAQLKCLGISANWERILFTLDESVQDAVCKTFVSLHKDGLIYRSERLVYWDPFFNTALSNLEVQNKEVDGHIWTLRYFLEGDDKAFIDVATTRPETLFADMAVAVHPKDERYKAFWGRRVRVPLSNRYIPILQDEHVDIAKGTGALKVTPAHDFVDFEIGKKHNLPFLSILDKNAKILDHEDLDVPSSVVGHDCLHARKLVLKMLEEKNILVDQKACKQILPFGDRSGALLEPLLTKQWFFDVRPLAKNALEACEESGPSFFPTSYMNTYKRWLLDIEPWCISRQLWWGHDIPSWSGPDGITFVAETSCGAYEQARKHYGKDVYLEKDPDVLDTWFSSALWPFVTLGWPHKKDDLEMFYPTTVLVTGFDIIFFWVARMVMMALHFTNKVPFKNVYIHGLVRDDKRQKMSKTKGNVIDPLEIISLYGVDALRFSLISLATPGQDIAFDTQHVVLKRNFLTKVWNAARFCMAKNIRFSGDKDALNAAHPVNIWIIKKYHEARESYFHAMHSFRFFEAAQVLYHFVWSTYCDVYIEMIKVLTQSSEKGTVKETLRVAGWVFGQVLVMLYPFIPFIASEIWESFSLEKKQLREKRLCEKAEPFALDTSSLKDVESVLDWAREIRFLRSTFRISFSKKLSLYVASDLDIRHDMIAFLRIFAGLSDIKVGFDSNLKGFRGEVSGKLFCVPLEGFLDLKKERERLQKKIIGLKNDKKVLDLRLSNRSFVEKAPKEKVDEIRIRHADIVKKAEMLESLRVSLC